MKYGERFSIGAFLDEIAVLGFRFLKSANST